MITDRMIEAAVRAFDSTMVRDVLETAESAAWSTDIENMPQYVDIIIKTRADDYFLGVKNGEYFLCDISLKLYPEEIIAWRHLPQLPKEAADET